MTTTFGDVSGALRSVISPCDSLQESIDLVGTNLQALTDGMADMNGHLQSMTNKINPKAMASLSDAEDALSIARQAVDVWQAGISQVMEAVQHALQMLEAERGGITDAKEANDGMADGPFYDE